MDAAKLEEIEALQRVTRRLEGKAPILVVTQEFNAAAVRILVQLQVADFLVKPIKTADLVRSCIRVAAGAGPRGKLGIADLHLHAGRRRRRHHDA